MNRRTTLLAVLILAACTADLPTAPGEAPGAPMGGALAPATPPPPPPPAAPTTVSGTLGGGDGRAVVTVIGYYETPVFARITFRGLLGYSGRPDGHLAGTGTLDAAGVLVANQCHLTLDLHWASPTGGSTVTAAPISSDPPPMRRGWCRAADPDGGPLPV